jgi:hypothetical protein
MLKSREKTGRVLSFWNETFMTN